MSIVIPQQDGIEVFPNAGGTISIVSDSLDGEPASVITIHPSYLELFIKALRQAKLKCLDGVVS